MLNTFLMLLQIQPVADASKPLIEYGVLGAVLLFCFIAIAYMYKQQVQERKDWAISDDKRLDRWDAANVRTTDALDQLSDIIKERIPK